MAGQSPLSLPLSGVISVLPSPATTATASSPSTHMLAAIPNGVVTVGRLGDDELRVLAAILRDNGVVFDSGTMLSFVTLHADGEREFIYHEREFIYHEREFIYHNTSVAEDDGEREFIYHEREFIYHNTSVAEDDELNIDLIETAQGNFIGAHDNQDLEEVQCRRKPIKTGEIMESCRRAYKWLMLQILQVIYANNDATASQLKEQKKRWSNYAMKALFFAITMFSASVYQSQSTPAAFTNGYRLFLVSISVSVVMDATLIILLPSWGNALVITTWLLLEVACCLVFLSFNGHCALAILAVLSLIIFVALLQPKLQHALEIFGFPSTKGGDTKEDTEDEENQYFEHLFDLAQGIANCGGLVTAIFGHYMVGPVTAAGFFLFCSISSLGLYIMMVTTVRAVSRPHVTYLAIVLMVLLVVTLITVSIPFARHSE